MKQRRVYPRISVAKYIFAALIPLLHIKFPEGLPILDTIREYLSRLGVPFFFACSGFFLIQSIEKYGKTQALVRQLKRIGKLLGIWLIIYVPIFSRTMKTELAPIRELLFRTPGYLWYLSALLVAIVPFCLINNRKIFYPICCVLYFFGTLMSSYSWLTGGWPAYEAVFVTFRNGVFFAPLLLCAGEYVSKKNVPRPPWMLLIITSAIYIAEVTIVRGNCDPKCDTSMYLALPGMIVAIMMVLSNASIDHQFTGFASESLLRQSSTAVYVMQYGIIYCFSLIGNKLGYHGIGYSILIYIATVGIPTILCTMFGKTKLLKFLF